MPASFDVFRFNLLAQFTLVTRPSVLSITWLRCAAVATVRGTPARNRYNYNKLNWRNFTVALCELVRLHCVTLQIFANL